MTDYTDEEMKTICSTIVQQLGGMGRLKSFVNAKNFTYDKKTCSMVFQFSGSKKCNLIRITLNSMDLYDLEFMKIGKEVKTVSKVDDVYNDMLISTFESETGLYLHF